MSMAISFDNHLFHEAGWKSHLFSGSQVHCQQAQGMDQQSCTVCAMAALVTSVMENPARDNRGWNCRLTRRQRLCHLVSSH